MARQTQLIEFNSFVGGLITEASPLTFPGNAALDIKNFNLDKDGSMSRRLGMDFEPSYSLIDSGVSVGASGEVSLSTTTWKNAGGDAKVSLVVVQIGNVLKFFNTNNSSVTSSLVYTHTFNTTDVTSQLSCAVVDGILVVVGFGKRPTAFTYDGGVIEASTYLLKIRDLFGVEDFAVVGGGTGTGPIAPVDLRAPENINKRPLAQTATGTHIYNLRNSTYAPLRMAPDTEVIEDPISSFTQDVTQFDAFGSSTEFRLDLATLPSNADAVTSALFADPEDGDDRLTERFYPKTLRRSPLGNSESPYGYFIIDALERGTSRLEQVQALGLSQTQAGGEYVYTVDTLPLDRTPGGATAVGEYAGRVWYTGFSGELQGGDSYSPRMSSYVLFSKLITSKAELGVCHQVGDPTSKETPDLLDTDGGFIRIEEAYGIKKLVNIGSALVVMAENGVWAVEGGSDFGFTAVAYKVSKVSNHGCRSANSALLVDNSLLYWADDGIYQVGRSEVGDITTTNVTNNTIQALYNNISDTEKESAQGKFDTYERKVRWLYSNKVSPVKDTKELILDVTLSAFYQHELPTTTSSAPNAVAYVEVPPFKIGEVVEGVVDSGTEVVDGGISLTNTVSVPVDGVRELLYLTLIDTHPTVTFTMSKYSDRDFLDWKSYDSVGIDTPALLVTGYDGGGDYQRDKQDPYITFHFRKTEDGFYEDELGDIYPLHPSSCKVQAQWEWANSANSGRWGKEFQAYRHKRPYIPQNIGDGFEDGFSVVTTKNKLRGKGKVLSLQIKTEPLKDCNLLGWSRVRTVAVNV